MNESVRKDDDETKAVIDMIKCCSSAIKVLSIAIVIVVIAMIIETGLIVLLI